MAEAQSERDEVFAELRELVRLARRCVSPFEEGDESTYTQDQAMNDLEAWFRRGR